MITQDHLVRTSRPLRRIEIGPEEETTMPQLIDTFGRVHNNLRISVTDRCNIRCFYCMPEEEVIFSAREELLRFEEIERFVRIVQPLGVNKLRLTGGEPLVRRNLPALVQKLAGIPGIRDIALTTNGVLLAQQAGALYEAGLRRINIHLDTLDADRFRQITRRDDFDRVLDGIFECKRLGYHPIKINAVAARGYTEDDVVPLGRFAREHDIEVRFIEYMPLDASNHWQRDKVLFACEIMERLESEIMPLVPVPDQDPRAPASDFMFADGVGRIGLIASVSRPFCASCNRIRLTSDGKLRNCLFAIDEFDVKRIMRGGGSDDEIADLVRRAVAAKWEGHEINTARFIKPSRPMYAIGG
jgi:cyclic pyranopterin phosphate synthase